MKKENIRKQLFVLLLGFVSATKGTAATALVVEAVVLFRSIPSISGYTAVVKFALGVAALGVALLLYYFCGRDIMRGDDSK